MSKIFFPLKGLTNADIMGFRFSNFNGMPVRRHSVKDIYEFLRKNDICTLHLGAELNIPVNGTKQNYFPCSRMFVMDIDTVELDPMVHLLMVSQISHSVFTNFIRENTKDMDQILVCCSGKGWHIYFAFKQLFWSSTAEEWQRDTENKIRLAIYKNVAPTPILSIRKSPNSYIPLHSNEYKWENEVLMGSEGAVWIPYWNRVWYERIEPYFVRACETHPNWFTEFGPIKSILHQMCCFTDGAAQKFVLKLFAPVSSMTTIAQIHTWINTMKEKMYWFQTDCMFKSPELVKITVAYACIELECRKTGFFIDNGLCEASHMLRAPFSPKIWDSGDDGYVSMPLGNPYTALENTTFALRISDAQPSILKTGVEHFNTWCNASLPKITETSVSKPKKEITKTSPYKTYELF